VSAPILSPVVVRYQLAADTLPKHLRLRQAVVDAVLAGELPIGSKVVGERELSELLGLSLGTTQKALGALMTDGFLVRRQGHGTFVGSMRVPISGSWHFRFIAPEGGPELPVFATIEERRLETAPGPWSEALGPDGKGHVMIRRSLDIGGEFRCASRMYLPAGRFSRLLRITHKRLTDTNLKAVLATEFGAPTLHSDGLAFLCPADPQDAALIGVQPGSTVLQVHITGRSIGRIPITYQLMTVPPTRYALKLDFNPPKAG
jgi:DNA-binding GntR family transcriptional regulator